MKAGALRVFAILIALAGVLDPAVTSSRETRPVLALVATDAAVQRDLIERTRQDLAGRFTVINAPFPGAAATVIVATRLPEFAAELASPVFAVLPEVEGPAVSIEAVHAPAVAAFEARIPVAVAARVTGAAGRRLVVTLRMGDLVVDRVEKALGAEQWQVVPLAFVPAAPGATPVRIAATVTGASRGATADFVIDVKEETRTVLFYDRRPSWMSTFVRRAVERDPRFAVTSRVVTSRNVSTDAGRPPAALDGLTPLAPFDAIVVGAPEALTERDVQGLDAFLRRRGGAVVLLFDRNVRGPYERLTEVGEWQMDSTTVSLYTTGADSAGLRATEIVWPASLPAGADAVAGDPDSGRPVVWRSAVGAGTLVVSGALDAWRFRDPGTSGFVSFWRSVIAAATDAATEPVDVQVERPVLTPGEWSDVTVTLRDAALADLSGSRSTRATVTAAIESPGGRSPFRLWPNGPAGRLTGSFRAPTAPGTYRLTVSADGNRASVPIVVAGDVSRVLPDQRDLVTAFASSRGGGAVPSSRLGELREMVARTVRPAMARQTWHPMRSPWWIVAFALCLGAEWWGRRRQGLA